MKNFLILSFGLLVIIGLTLSMSSCGGEDLPPSDCIDPPCDEPIDTIPQYPILKLMSGEGFLTESSQVRPGDSFNLLLMGTKGDYLLSTMQILLNGQLLPVENYKVEGVQPTSSQFTITGDERNEFLWEIEIRSSSEATRVIYEFQLQDASGREDKTGITIDTKLTANSPPSVTVVADTIVEIKNGMIAEFVIELNALGSPIDSIAIYKAENIFLADRIYFKGEKFTSNPMPLESSDRYGFRDTIGIIPEAVTIVDEQPVIQGYSLIMTDSLGVTYSNELIISIIE